jgi:pSer/pThr/pTyr-binding forkhead associated (FHA) protein
VFDALPNRAMSVPGDQTVAAHNAVIRREGRNSAVSQAGGGQVLINRRPVAGRQAVRSGDRVKIGGTLFIFRERAQAAQT